MVSYKELGLVNSRDMFAKAINGGYAIPAFNFNNMEQMQAIIQACVETKSPVILQVSSGARKYANQTILRYMAQGAVEYAKELGHSIPIVLHLDHGDSFELCKSCIEMGFSSVMIDGSHLPYDENVALTKKVVDYAHQFDVTVEGELGVLAGVEDDVKAESHTYTRPEEVEDFVKKTGVDSLAISIGTSHGAYKFKPGQKPEIRLDILAGFDRNSRRSVETGCKICGMQDQYRQRRTSCNDCGNQKGLCRASGGVRSTQISRTCKRETQRALHAQSPLCIGF